MNRDTVLKLLREHSEEVRKRYGARHLALFGSAARDELRGDSDIDVLVEFEGPATFDGYICLLSTSPSPRDRPRTRMPPSA